MFECLAMCGLMFLTWPSYRSTGFAGIILDEKATLALQSAAPEAGSESDRQSQGICAIAISLVSFGHVN